MWEGCYMYSLEHWNMYTQSNVQELFRFMETVTESDLNV